MRLYSLELAWRLRRAVRHRVRQSKVLRSRAKWQNLSLNLEQPWIYEPLIFICLSVVVASEYSSRGSAWLTASLTLYCTATSVLRSHQLQTILTVSPERMFFNFYPLSDANFFRWCFESFLWKTVRIWLVSGIAFGFVFGSSHEPWFFLTAAFATLQWLLTLAVTLILSAYVYGISKWVHVALYAATAVVCYAGPKAYITPAYPVLKVLPAGWTGGLAASAFHGGRFEWLAMFALIAIFASAAWMFTWKLRSRVVAETAPGESASAILRETTKAQPFSNVELEIEALLQEPKEELEEEVEQDWPQTEWQKMRLQIAGRKTEGYTLSRDWLAPSDLASESWLSRLAAGWLNQREKMTAEFLLGDFPTRWNELWRASVITAAFACVLLVLRTEIGATLGISAAALSALLGVPILGGSWMGTNSGWLSGKLSPILGCYPLDYRTACHTMWKINLVRTGVWAPVGLLLGAVVGVSEGFGIGQSVWFIVKSILSFAAAIPLLSAGHFSKSTNDTTNLRLSKLPFIGVVVLFGVMLVTSTIFTLVLAALWPMATLAATLALSVMGWWLYGLYYEHGEVDLLRERK